MEGLKNSRHVEGFASALAAALRRTNPMLARQKVALEREVAWLLIETPLSSRGSIFWRRMPLGVALARTLSEEQNHRCCYCGKRTSEEASNRSNWPSIEHIIPLSEGGQDHPDNMVMACIACNSTHAPANQPIKDEPAPWTAAGRRKEYYRKHGY